LFCSSLFFPCIKPRNTGIASNGLIMASNVVNMLMNKVMDEFIGVPLVGLGLLLDCVAGEVAGRLVRDGQPVSPVNHLTSSKSGSSNDLFQNASPRVFTKLARASQWCCSKVCGSSAIGLSSRR